MLQSVDVGRRGLDAHRACAGEDRDPVCGMRIDGAGVHPTRYRGREFRFCSDSCARQFAADPELFWRAVARARHGTSPVT
ncbi:YHS domain-containing protein [Streptomyces sp. NPDC096152]|uniref:YHS domain-containing protein n=1 Tax=Streptomyces sp. NPDC096152 TaxID=3366078 RepID=UPI003827C57A